MWLNTFVRNFQKQNIQLAGEALERFDKNDRNISTITLSTTEEGFERIQDLIRDFQNDVIKVVEEYEDVEKILQLNLQFFPLCRDVSQLNNEI